VAQTTVAALIDPTDLPQRIKYGVLFHVKFHGMKICSLLPSATEILFALGLDDEIVGVSHECDFPSEAKSKSVVIKSRISHRESAATIDRQVREFLERGESLYTVDLELLRDIEPDLIVTQDLCQVCAATPDDLIAGLAQLRNKPRIVTLNAHSLADVCADIRKVSEATGTTERGDILIAEFEEKIANVETSVLGLDHPRVLCLEWLDPLYVAGHWVPEMVERAGGVDVLGQRGKQSFRVEWDDVMEARPDMIIIMPCGYDLAAAEAEFHNFPVPKGWEDMPAVKEAQVFVVEASGYFSRPGPRLSIGLEVLASALHSTKRDHLPKRSSDGMLVRVASVG